MDFISKKICRRANLLLLLVVVLVIACTRQYVVLGYIEGYYTNLSPSVGGTLQKLYVDRGDSIHVNQLLFELDPLPEKAQLEQAKYRATAESKNLENLLKGQRTTIIEGIKAQIAQAEANFKYAQQTLTRNQAQFRLNAISKATLDQSIANYDSTSQQVKQLQANLAEAQLGARQDLIKAQEATTAAAKSNVAALTWSLQQKTMYAPVNALVTDRYYQLGEYIPAGQAVLQVLTPGDIKLIFFVPERLFSQIKIGQTVHFGCDSCQGKTPAKITFISPRAEYTPPVIYSRDIRHKLVYRIEAEMQSDVAVNFHPGQPVDVYI